MPLDKDSQASPLSVLLGAQSREGTGIVFVSTSDHRQVRIALDAGRIVYVGFGFRRGRIAAQFAASATAVSATFSPGQVELVDNDLPPERALLAELAPMLAGGARGGFGEPPVDEHPPVPASGPTTVQRAPAPASGVTTAQHPPTPPSGVTTTQRPPAPPSGVTTAQHPPAPSSGVTTAQHPPAAASEATRPRTMPAPPRAIDRARIGQIRRALVEYVGPMAEVLVDEQLAAGVQDLDALVERLAEQIDNARLAQAFRDTIRKQRR